MLVTCSTSDLRTLVSYAVKNTPKSRKFKPLYFNNNLIIKAYKFNHGLLYLL